jgi:hypothetical protein
MLNKTEIPLLILEAYKELKIKCKKIAEKNENILECFFYDETLQIKFLTKDPNSNFHFTIIRPALIGAGLKKTTLITFSAIPKNIIEPSERRVLSGSVDGILTEIPKWIADVKKYSEFSLDIEDSYEKKYQNEYINDLLVEEEDGEKMPFDIKRQEVIIDFLNYIEEHIPEEEKNDEATKAIIKEIGWLRNNVQKITKNQTAKSWSKIRAKIKMKGYDFMKKIFGQAKDEIIKFAIKKALETGYDDISHFITNHLLS